MNSSKKEKMISAVFVEQPTGGKLEQIKFGKLNYSKMHFSSASSIILLLSLIPIINITFFLQMNKAIKRLVLLTCHISHFTTLALNYIRINAF